MSKKMLQNCCIFLFLIIACGVLAQESPSLVTNSDYYYSSRYNNARKSARTPDGTIMVVWEPNGTPSKEVTYSIYDFDFASWGEPQQLSNSEKGDTGGPSIVADDNGNIYACWKQYNLKPNEDGDKRDFMFAKWDGTQWSVPVPVEEDTSNAGYGSIALGADGTIFVAYTDYGTSWGPQYLHACWSTDDGVSWNEKKLTTEELYSDIIEPALTPGPDGTMVCAWYDEPDTANKTENDRYPIKELIISIFDGNTWSEKTVITPMLDTGDTLNCQYPSMATDSQDRPHIVYTVDENYVYHATLNGTELVNPIRIDASTDKMSILRSCIAIDDNDNIYVVWQEETISSDAGSIDNAKYSVSADGGMTWTEPVQISDCTAEDGSGRSVMFPTIGRKVRSVISDVFEGGADVTYTQYNPDSESGWDLWYYRIPLVSTSIKQDEVTVSNEFSLSQNYPNPFNPSTEIKFNIPETGIVELSIYNTLGQKIKVLEKSKLNASQYSYSWDGRDEQNNIMPSGIYFYQLKTENYSSTKRMVFLR